MPVLLIYGMPDVGEAPLKRLTDALQDAVSGALSIPPSQVSVFYPVDRMQSGLGEELVCFVEGLFSMPERTIGVRQRLADSLENVLSAFAVVLGPPRCRMVEVFVKQFDPKNDGFASSELVRG